MIITISREFGSGGRELGKRLSDKLQIPYYDKEIITLASRNLGFEENYVSRMSEKGIKAAYALTIGHRLMPQGIDHTVFQTIQVNAEQHNIIRDLARQGNCIIIGRCADIILAEYAPFSIFVYADMASKIIRCMDRMQEGEHLSRKETAKQIREIDRNRRSLRKTYSDDHWGAKENFSLCINTSGIEIKAIVPSVAEYAKAWFLSRKTEENLK